MQSRFHMTREELKQMWEDPHNRKFGFYYCKSDPRVIVPRRLKWMGWTINTARPSAVPTLLGIFGILIIPALMVRELGGSSPSSGLTVLVSILVVSLLCAYLSSANRWAG